MVTKSKKTCFCGNNCNRVRISASLIIYECNLPKKQEELEAIHNKTAA